jgi:hypothetical protein
VSRRRSAVRAPWPVIVLLAATLAACGLEVQEPDLFLIKRTGEGSKLTELVNSDGTITCNGKQGKPLASPLLITARDIQPNIHYDAQQKLHIPRSPNAVYMYSVETDSGTITFPDTAGAHHPSLAQLELFTLQAAQSSCGIS